MTARISLIPGKSRGHRPRLQLPESRVVQILFQRDLVLVAVRKHRIGEGPLDSNIRIIPGYPAFRLRPVIFRLLVLDLTHLRHREKSVSKTDWDEQLFLIFCRELDAKPFPKS